MEKELVSVLITAYNHENYVQEAIKSIIDQTYQNIELIIIDDGSKDRTWEKIQEMREECEHRFANVHFETKNNEGAALTLKKLFKMAKGKYIYCASSDDKTKNYTIKKCVDFLENNPNYGIVIGNDEFIDSNSKKCFWKNNKKEITYNENEAKYKTFVDFLKVNKNYFDNDEFGTYKTLYKCNYIPNGHVFRKFLLDKYITHTKEKIIEDWFMMLQFSKYVKFKYINEIFLSYRWHNDNTITKEDYMNEIAKNTVNNELEVLTNIIKNKALQKDLLPGSIKVFKEAINFYNYGDIYKRFVIPYIFEIVSYRKCNKKTKIIKLFNIPVIKYHK